MDANIMGVTQDTLNKTAQSMKDDALTKAIDTGTGLRGYNLEAPAKQLVPFFSPLRNMIPRHISTTGNAVNWKAITDIRPSGKATALEGTRGNGMKYKVKNEVAALKVISLQDAVTFEAEAAGRNFQDVRATSATNLLLSVMSQEEKYILGGTTKGIEKPSAPIVTAADNANSTIAAGDYSVKVAAMTLIGSQRVTTNHVLPSGSLLGVPATDENNETIAGAFDGVTAASDATSITVKANQSITATVKPVKGAMGYAWFVGKAGSETLQIVTSTSAVELTELAEGSSAAPTADGSADPMSFDGIIPQILDGGGIFLDLGNKELTPRDGGVLELDTINSRLFQDFKNGADVYLVSEDVSKAITRAIVKTNGAPTLFVNNGEKGSITGGYKVQTYVNASYGGHNIKIMVHPYLPNGTLVAMCNNVPYPNANVPSVLEMECGYDYRMIEYDRTSPKYEYEIRTFEALKHYFPACQAVITNIKVA